MKKLWENLKGTREEQIKDSILETYNGYKGKLEGAWDLVDIFVETVLEAQGLEYNNADLNIALDVAKDLLKNKYEDILADLKHAGIKDADAIIRTYMTAFDVNEVNDDVVQAIRTDYNLWKKEG